MPLHLSGRRFGFSQMTILWRETNSRSSIIFSTDLWAKRLLWLHERDIGIIQVKCMEAADGDLGRWLKIEICVLERYKAFSKSFHRVGDSWQQSRRSCLSLQGVRTIPFWEIEQILCPLSGPLCTPLICEILPSSIAFIVYRLLLLVQCCEGRYCCKIVTQFTSRVIIICDLKSDSLYLLQCTALHDMTSCSVTHEVRLAGRLLVLFGAAVPEIIRCLDAKGLN